MLFTTDDRQYVAILCFDGSKEHIVSECSLAESASPQPIGRGDTYIRLPKPEKDVGYTSMIDKQVLRGIFSQILTNSISHRRFRVFRQFSTIVFLLNCFVHFE